MSKPPTPTQRTYRGRIRADMRSALNHLLRLYGWNQKYTTGPITNYPNQLATPANMVSISGAIIELQMFLASLGPIPSR
jgi:hypothetical protein